VTFTTEVDGVSSTREPSQQATIIMDNRSRNGNNETIEIEKAKAVITVELVEYLPNSVVIKTILHKSTGNVSVMSVDQGEGLTERTSPFDTYVQVIDGQADIVIRGVSNLLHVGQSIVIPAHASNMVAPNGRFKLLMTVIKSGYE
jgi:quercetin dioxygenase-like cupin family protein